MPELTTKVSRVRLFLGPYNSLIICASLRDTPTSTKQHLEIVFPHSSPTTLTSSSKKYLFALIPTPRTFESIRLQIRSSDWVIHIPIPIDLEAVESLDEVEEEEEAEEIELAVATITHPWQFTSKIQGTEEEAKVCLSRLIKCRITTGNWIKVKRGLFTDCRICLRRDAAGCLTLEAMSW